MNSGDIPLAEAKDNPEPSLVKEEGVETIGDECNRVAPSGAKRTATYSVDDIVHSA